MLDLENFILDPAEMNQIYKFIQSQARPIPLKELAEMIIRRRLESHASAQRRRIYSPEQKYSLGEKIFFYLPDNKFVLAEILSIEPYVHSKYGPMEKIDVSLEGHEKKKTYVSNCPRLPLRFNVSPGGVMGAKGQITTPGQIFTKFQEKITFSMEQILSSEDELVKVGKHWFVKEALPRIREDEIRACFHFIKKNGIPIPSSELACNVLKCSPDSPKYELFGFSLDYHLLNHKDFVEHHSFEGIKWDIRRAVPPRQIRNKLTSASIAYGFIKITKGLQELLDYCSFSDEITLKAYGEYEVRGHVDLSLQRISGDEIKNWFVENGLRPGDIIYIKTPTAPDDPPILYTAFESETDKEGLAKNKQRSIRKANLRHTLHNILYRQGEYLHVKELHRRTQESCNQSITQATVEAILSLNKHLFARLPGVRGLWGLLQWESGQPGIDAISLSLAINEEDWVVRVLEEQGRPLAVTEIAEKLASVFITPKDKILEITFLNTNDERLLEMNGKWGLKRWAEDWIQRIKQIDLDLLKHERLSNAHTAFLAKQKQLEATLLKLEEGKTIIQSHLAKLNQYIDAANDKLSNYKSRNQELVQELEILNSEISANTKIRYLIIMPVFLILAIIGLSLPIKNPYPDLSLVFSITALLLFFYFGISEIRRRVNVRKLSRRKSSVEDDISRIDKYSKDVEEKRLIAESKLTNSLKKGELVDSKVGALSHDLEVVTHKIEDFSSQMERFDLEGLISEKESLTDLVRPFI